MKNDLKYALRQLANNPGFAAAAVLTLALGIGANTAIFSAVDRVLLRPLPYRDPQRLVMLFHDNSKTGQRKDFVSFQALEEFRARLNGFEQMAAVSPPWSQVLNTEGEPERLASRFVSADFFPLLGVTPARGRGFQAAEDRPGAPATVIVSQGFWQSHFAGRSFEPVVITLNRNPVTIVGVLPAGFRFQEDADLWMPISTNPLPARGRIRFLQVIGRLRPGVAWEQAAKDAAGVARQMEKENPESQSGLGVTVLPLEEQVVGEARPALLLLLGAVGCLLLIACANVANLLLARGASRSREVAVRAALGAGRVRLLRQFLAESLLLSLLGAAAGLLLAYWGVDLIRGIGGAYLPRAEEITINPRILGFTLAVTAVIGGLFGLLPALQLSGAHINESLQEGGRAVAGKTSGKQRKVLTVVEVALALLLMTGTGLLARSFARLLGVDPGFQVRNVLTLQIGIPPNKYAQPPQQVAFYRQLFERLEALPGVQAAGGTTRLPLREGVSTYVEVEGHPKPPSEAPEIEFRRASNDYFRAMGIPLLEGRTFSDRDTADRPSVSLVNQTAARRLWGGETPVGKRLRLTQSQQWTTVVGVVGDIRHFGLDHEVRPEMYISFLQGPPSTPLLALRTTGDPAALASAVRNELRGLEPELVIWNIAPLEELLAGSMASRRHTLGLIGLFALVALALAAVGIYGVLAYGVTQRMREMAVRMALGARPADVLRLVIGEGMRMVVAGAVLGLIGSVLLARFLTGLLYGVSPLDLSSYAASVVLLVLVALLACYVPARRATRVDPVTALRYE